MASRRALGLLGGGGVSLASLGYAANAYARDDSSQGAAGGLRELSLDAVPSRAQQLARIADNSSANPFDVLVIGGGATGTGCAFDAATRYCRNPGGCVPAAAARGVWVCGARGGICVAACWLHTPPSTCTLPASGTDAVSCSLCVRMVVVHTPSCGTSQPAHAGACPPCTHVCTHAPHRHDGGPMRARTQPPTRSLALRNLRTALVEREDFASGTSSRSTKMVHGGVRYLEKAVFNLDYSQLKLVYEALHERENLLANASHLARPLPILTVRARACRGAGSMWVCRNHLNVAGWEAV